MSDEELLVIRALAVRALKLAEGNPLCRLAMVSSVSDVPRLVDEVRRLRARESARAQAIRDMIRPTNHSMTVINARWEA